MEGGDGGQAVDGTLVAHRLGPTGDALLGGLEEEPHGPAELGGSGEDGGDPDGDGGVGVVAAGVHEPVMLGAERHVGVLVDG